MDNINNKPKNLAIENRSSMQIMRLRLYEKLHCYVHYNTISFIDKKINSKLYNKIFDNIYMASVGSIYINLSKNIQDLFE